MLMSRLFARRRCLGVSRFLHTIYAMSSGTLPSALAIIRITGDEAKQTLSLLTKRSDFVHRMLFYTPFYTSNNEIVDRGMAVFMAGEDTAELYVHGSRAVVDYLLDDLGRNRQLSAAKAGEFTRRAFMNGKMDVAQTEALADLLQAETREQLQLAHRQNDAARHLKPIRERLINIYARLEASIDFSEDIETQTNASWRDVIVADVDALATTLRTLLGNTRRGLLVRSGLRIALVGRTNAGKSSLINQLANRDVAIVSSQPGTTRDSLEARLVLPHLPPMVVADTAGLRAAPADELEAEGMRRTIQRVREAQLVVFVVGADSLFAGLNSLSAEIDYLQQTIEATDEEDAKMPPLIICINKSDLLAESRRRELQKYASKRPLVLTSTLSEGGVEMLIDTLREQLSTRVVGEDGHDLFLSRERHVQLLERAIEHLDDFVTTLADDTALATQLLRNCADCVGEIAGTVLDETILNRIFSQFCVGK